MDEEVTRRFTMLTHSEGLGDRLGEAALLVAAHARPDLDINSYLARLDDIADACSASALEAVLDRIYGVEDFRGDRANYGHPSNSLLDQVLDRRRGIPLTLALVLIEVGRRRGVPLEGVGMPGHFLVRLPSDPPRYVDPFTGEMLDEAGCRRVYARVHGADAPFHPSYLSAASPVAMTSRLLLNLARAYESSGDLGSLEWVRRLRAALPSATTADHAAWASSLATVGRFDLAAGVFESLAAVEDGQVAERLASSARRLWAQLN